MNIENWLILSGVIFSIVINIFPLINQVQKLIRKKRHTKHTEETRKWLIRNHPKERNLPNFTFWKENVEPKYKNLNYYPADWGIRKKYIAEIYNYTCAVCSKYDRLGHSHHIISLTEGGTNAINNLAYLCRICHENQHWHLLQKQEARDEEIKKQGITETEYFKGKREEYQQLREIYKAIGNPNKKINALRARAIRAEKSGKNLNSIKILQ